MLTHLNSQVHIQYFCVTDLTFSMNILSGILRHDDITKRPERFFLAHRLLAFHSPQLGEGKGKERREGLAVEGKTKSSDLCNFGDLILSNWFHHHDNTSQCVKRSKKNTTRNI